MRRLNEKEKRRLNLLYNKSKKVNGFQKFKEGEYDEMFRLIRRRLAEWRLNKINYDKKLMNKLKMMKGGKK